VLFSHSTAAHCVDRGGASAAACAPSSCQNIMLRHLGKYYKYKYTRICARGIICLSSDASLAFVNGIPRLGKKSRGWCAFPQSLFFHGPEIPFTPSYAEKVEKIAFFGEHSYRKTELFAG